MNDATANVGTQVEEPEVREKDAAGQKKLLPAWNVLGLRKRTINSCQLRGSATALAQKDRQLRARSLDRSIILRPELPVR